ncbi:2-oxoglutarate and iron-dependent oxygenase domain-containing protein 2, partial [Durusdinium trenchii]
MPCQRAASTIAANKWRNPVKSLARLFWLGAPLSKEGSFKDHFDSKALPAQIRSRQHELDGPDLALLLAAMKGPK